MAQRGCGWRTSPTVDGLADGLRIATSTDTATLRRMGEAGRALIAVDYAWPAIAERFAALYADAAKTAG
jgi:glycosyltransferase involved in cell wall biosynthesis